MKNSKNFSMGIEEEYFLVHKSTMEIIIDPPEAFFKQCQKASDGLIVHEFLRSQVEINTKPCFSIKALEEALSHLRALVVEIADQFDMAPLASSTHPSAAWCHLKVTDKERYLMMAEKYQHSLLQNAICGMHMHIGIENPDERVGVFNLMGQYLPYLLAFSTSSPFWEGKDTGLCSYRTLLNDQLPRSGPPEVINNYQEYTEILQWLVNAGLIEDASEIWWDMRLCAKFPTIEARAADICTYLDDALAIAALYQCLVHKCHQVFLADPHAAFQNRIITKENRWRAQRYGLTQGLMNVENNLIKKEQGLIDALVNNLAEEIDLFDCENQINHLYTILTRGTSADMQRKMYQDLMAAGTVESEAISLITRRLTDITRENR